MYLSYFKLKEHPFQITTDPKFLWLGDKHKEALAVLRYGIMENKGFVLLSGEVGTGKTVLINRLISMLDPKTVVATIPDPGLKDLDFFNYLAHCFRIKGPFEQKGEFLIRLREFLTRCQAANRTVLLVIDEAQRLAQDMLEEIRLLSNIEMQDRKLINIFFVGQQEFYGVLQKERNRAVSQRITIKYQINPLKLDETRKYVRHRLAVAGTENALFGPNALQEIFEFSGGIPRLINIVADHALLTGFARGKKKIDGDIVRECARELHIPIQKPSEPDESRRSAEEIRQQTIEEIKELIIAGNRGAGGPPAANLEAPPPESRRGRNKERRAESTPQTPPASKRHTLRTVLLGLLMVVALVAAGYQWVQHTSGEIPLWGMEELTPTKYKTTLEEKKQTIEAHLAQNPAGIFEEEPQTASPEVRSDDPVVPLGLESGKPKPTDTEPGGELSGEAASSPAEPESQPAGDVQVAARAADGDSAGPLAAETTVVPFPGNNLRIHFQLNSNEIASEAYKTLDQVAAYIAANPGTRIDVKGYSDSQGGKNYNRSVSRFRAHVVKSYLIGKGAAGDGIRTLGLGDLDPIADNSTPEGREKNRRVEIEFVTEGRLNPS